MEKGVILKLSEFGIKGKMLKWINNFLENRKIRVRVEDQVSDYQETKNGSPQGMVTQSNSLQCYYGHFKNSHGKTYV